MRVSIGILAIIALCGLLSAPALAQAPASTDYELQIESQFAEGCFEPCMCPIWSVGVVRGSFSLNFSTMDGSFHMFQVLDVEWEFPRGENTIAVVGSGSYRVDPEAGLQQLELDLQVGEDPVDHYDSGLVEVVEDLPKISIAIAMNEFYCYDRVFEILAAPSPVILTRETSWGTLKAHYED